MPATGGQQQVSRRKEIGSRLEQLHDILDAIGEHAEKLGKAGVGADASLPHLGPPQRSRSGIAPSGD
jgi:hypothetical protein